MSHPRQWAATSGWQFFAHCPTSGKRSYPVRRFAKQALRRQRDMLGVEMHVYRCPSCGHFHWGHRR